MHEIEYISPVEYTPPLSLLGGFMKYGVEGTLGMVVMLYNWMWKNEYAPRRWREGVVVNFSKKGDKADWGGYEGTTLVSTVGKATCKNVNFRMGTMIGEKEDKTSEGQAGFGPNRSCVDHVYTIGKLFQGRKDAGLTAHCLFLDVQKAYDTAWRRGLWEKKWEIGIRGKMWRYDEKDDGVCDKCCDAGRGNVERC